MNVWYIYTVWTFLYIFIKQKLYNSIFHKFDQWQGHFAVSGPISFTFLHIVYKYWSSSEFGVIFMSIGWDIKWCPVSRKANPLARKRPFHWISTKSRLVRAAMETSKFHKKLVSCRRCMAEILPIRRKTLYTINQS